MKYFVSKYVIVKTVISHTVKFINLYLLVQDRIARVNGNETLALLILLLLGHYSSMLQFHYYRFIVVH